MNLDGKPFGNTIGKESKQFIHSLQEIFHEV